MRYLLFRYNLNFEESVCFEHESPDVVANEAMKRSKLDEYTYRMERWADNTRTYTGFRFFQEGREFTNDIVNSLISTT